MSTEVIALEETTAQPHTMHIQDHTGDTTVSWLVDNEIETEAARKHFKRLKKAGYLAYRTDADGGRAEVIQEFDPAAGRIIMSPQLVGG